MIISQRSDKFLSFSPKTTYFVVQCWASTVFCSLCGSSFLTLLLQGEPRRLQAPPHSQVPLLDSWDKSRTAQPHGGTIFNLLSVLPFLSWPPSLVGLPLGGCEEERATFPSCGAGPWKAHSSRRNHPSVGSCKTERRQCCHQPHSGSSFCHFHIQQHPQSLQSKIGPEGMCTCL